MDMTDWFFAYRMIALLVGLAFLLVLMAQERIDLKDPEAPDFARTYSVKDNLGFLGASIILGLIWPVSVLLWSYFFLKDRS